MRHIHVYIDYSDGNYGATGAEVLGCIATGSTLAEVKEMYASALEFHREGCEPGELEDWIARGDYELVYELSTSALLKHYSSLVSLSAISRKTGIHQTQLSHYISGVRAPRKDKRERIVDALHSLGEELISVQ